MQAHELEAIIRSKVDGVEKLIVSDVSGGCGQAFDVIIVSTIFEGLPTLQRHRKVNDLLKDQIAQLHAFSQKTYTPAQYQNLSGSSASASATGGSSSTDTTPPAPAPFTFGSGSLAAPKTPPTKSRSSATSASSSAAAAAHNRTASNVSIPELTLTTDEDTLSGQAAHGAPRPLAPGAQPGGTTSQLPDMHSSPQSPAPSISRLHYAKISSPEFWEGLRGYLESQLITNAPGSPAAAVDNPLASPSAASNSNSNHVRGEAELVRLFEEFLQSQKPHLSASDVAKVRDGTGMFGM